jgi:hypothetical protein
MNSYSEPIVTMPYGEQPAFPCDVPVAKYTSGERKADAAGLTVRDYFASKALAGLLASEADSECGGAVHGQQLTRRAAVYAALAYELADAMLAARAVPPKSN